VGELIEVPVGAGTVVGAVVVGAAVVGLAVVGAAVVGAEVVVVGAVEVAAGIEDVGFELQPAIRKEPTRTIVIKETRIFFNSSCLRTNFFFSAICRGHFVSDSGRGVQLGSQL
jgi:hypothetical protein